MLDAIKDKIQYFLKLILVIKYNQKRKRKDEKFILQTNANKKKNIFVKKKEMVFSLKKKR